MSRNYKTLDKYYKMLSDEGLLVNYSSESNVLIKGLSYNSKHVTEGTLFVCKGLNFKEAYLMEALKKGAVAYVCEQI